MSNQSYYFCAEVARQVLDDLARKRERTEISVDLNRSVASFALVGEALVLEPNLALDKVALQQIAAKANKVFLLEDGDLVVLEQRGKDYYKLVPTAAAPLLEISGVKMHISKGINPFTSAGQMAAQVVRPGQRVLDTCSGLGYAAVAALKLGAREVVSVELSPIVMDLRRKNPWSEGLLAANIHCVNADIGRYIATLAAGSFEAVIHDPPRFSLAGELYGEAFYRELHRVLHRRGSLFHYTGNPQLLKRGSGFMDGVIQRLKAAGFAKVVKNVDLMGVTASK